MPPRLTVKSYAERVSPIRFHRQFIMEKSKLLVCDVEETAKLWNSYDINETCLLYSEGEPTYIVKKEDVPDVIVNWNEEKGSADLKFVNYFDELLCNTFGPFLNQCDQTFRNQIIRRLTSLQMFEVDSKPVKLLRFDVVYALNCSEEI